jgi:hypothetical protein
MTTLIDALDGAYQHRAKVIVGIDDTQLALPTPCSQWDIRATIDHLIGATWMFALVNQGQAVGEDAGGIAGRDLDPYRAHGAFGSEVPIDSSAPPADRLLAQLGRQPVRP